MLSRNFFQSKFPASKNLLISCIQIFFMIKPFCPICEADVDNAVCTECGYNQAAAAPQEIEIELQEAKKLLDNGAVLVDVRRPDELEIAKIHSSVHMQLDTLPRNFSELDKTKLIITQCHHGVRSLHAARFLCQKGFRARSLAGGIERWSLEIDGAVPRY